MQQAVLIFLVLLFVRCNPQGNETIAPQKTLQTNSNAQILNGIVVHQTGGLEIYRAFLSHPDGTLLNSRNSVRTGDTVCLNLVVKGGWIAEDGIVSIGAAQTLVGDDGERLFSSPDLFAGSPKMDQAKAAQLQLKTTLTKLRPDTRTLIVHYKVWDKTGAGEVAGRYRLQLRNDK